MAGSMIVAIVPVNPSGNFPVNDDWAREIIGFS